MAVTFVKPRLDRMLQDRRDGTYYRVLAERDFGYVTYRCESVSALEWDLHWDFWYSIEDNHPTSPALYHAERHSEQWKRYWRWQTGDASATPQIFNWQEGLELRDLGQSQDYNRDLLFNVSSTTVDDIALLGAWSKHIKRIKYGQIGRYYAFCEDPYVIYLHSYQNEAERTKARTLAAYLEPLDLVQLAHELKQGQTSIEQLGAKLGLPSFFVDHLLNIWCTFGCTQEGLVYVLQLISYPPPSLLGNLKRPAFAMWAQSVWASWYCQLAQVVDVNNLGENKPDNWEQSLSQFGLPLLIAFGGAEKVPLYGMKHSELLGPTLDDFKAYLAARRNGKRKSKFMGDFVIEEMIGTFDIVWNRN